LVECAEFLAEEFQGPRGHRVRRAAGRRPRIPCIPCLAHELVKLRLISDERHRSLHLAKRPQQQQAGRCEFRSNGANYTQTAHAFSSTPELTTSLAYRRGERNHGAIEEFVAAVVRRAARLPG
jgi:hypothetical protein